MKAIKLTLAAPFVVALSLQLSSAEIDVPLPQFDSKSKLQEKAARQVTAQVSLTGLFYTGKPFDNNQESYLFKYRSYDAKLNRWTSPDSSGFPDGANNCVYINNKTLNAIDPTGESISLYNHSVALVGYHAFIYYAHVQAPDGNSEYTGTISGQPQNQNSPMNWGNLISTTDTDLSSDQQNAFTLNYSSYGYKSEWCFLQDLQGAAGSYGNNLAYDPVPTPTNGKYNSNGFINGVLSSLGINNTGYSGFGWSEKVPITYTARYTKVNTVCAGCE